MRRRALVVVLGLLVALAGAYAGGGQEPKQAATQGRVISGDVNIICFAGEVATAVRELSKE
jgi:hypothetical protein